MFRINNLNSAVQRYLNENYDASQLVGWRPGGSPGGLVVILTSGEEIEEILFTSLDIQALEEDYPPQEDYPPHH